MVVCLAEGQFKMIDSANFRTKKGVANNSNIAFVQINHFVDPQMVEQSRAFATVEQEVDDPNLIKVHIQYQQQKNEIHSAPQPKLLSSSQAIEAPSTASVANELTTSSSSSGNHSSSLHRIIASNRNRKKLMNY